MLWNIVLAGKLPQVFQPEIFWKDIPPFLMYGESISRIAVFAVAYFIPLNFPASFKRKGFYVYLLGLLLYFVSWILLIYLPDSNWSTSLLGFMAPAYTPLLWLVGIGLIGESFYFNLPYKRWIFILLSIVFLAFHNLHAITIYWRVY